MGKNLVNLTVNPCKMCMPMGGVSAFMGIKNCMCILHGSQGCATYIRRHMATHYNEPVDIASSSLTEHGTVFGGEENLLTGLKNMIDLYQPDVIGIATTCLAETIGEDVQAIVKKFYDQNPNENVKIITSPTAGYSGTQYEGFFSTLKAIVEQTVEASEKNDYINIITPLISPADTRWLKTLLDASGLKYILLPDISENLDGVYSDHYKRLKSGGTSIEDIQKMSGARLTIEFTECISEKDSPAEYLKNYFDVPLIRMPLPIGLQMTDLLLTTLKDCGGQVSPQYAQERGRYLDAMIDAHKYCAEGRAAIFGEPDFVCAMTRLCCENGVVPVLVSTGAYSAQLKDIVSPMVQIAADRMMIEKTIIMDHADFEQIGSNCEELEVNVLIGNSDARRLEHKLHIDLIRCAFPIHDRVGGQRIMTLGYEGSLSIIDNIANSLLGNKESTFREKIHHRFFGSKKPPIEKQGVFSVQPKLESEIESNVTLNSATDRDKLIAQKTRSHPCFNCGAGKNARIHLPIAPKCNIQCNYCVRKYDCPNESRPGVSTDILSAEEAFERFVETKAKMSNLKVVGIAGPGDALANWPETKKALSLIKEYDPDITFCLSTNGLMLPTYAAELIELGVTHVTVTINTIDVQVGAKIYKHISYMGENFEGVAAAAILIANQMSGLKYLTERGVICKVNCVVLKGINEDYIFDVTQKAKALGAYMTNIMPHIAVQGSAFEHLEKMSNKELARLREKCEVNIKQMKHCRQCRADAVGTLDNDQSIHLKKPLETTANTTDIKTKKIAVASKDGQLVDLHFGHADTFYVYESDGNTTRFVEKRSVPKYCTGVDDCEDKDEKINQILSSVSDCDVILAIRIGHAPLKRLADKGISVIQTYDRIESAVPKAASEAN